MLTLATFRTSHPEFNGVSDAMVNAYLTKAALQVDPVVWGTLNDTGVEYLTAHLLATTPFGQNARLSTADGSSVYEREYRRMQLIVSSGYRVA